MSPEGWIGWDLGGANLKAAQLDASGRVLRVAQVACPLWQGLDRLQAGIDQVVAQFGGGCHAHAVTMTGELADLFESRARGVEVLVAAMRERFAGEPIQIYAGRAGFVRPERAGALVPQVASANWAATCALAASELGAGLAIDVGSTTTDVLPFADGEMATWGETDQDRLVHGELVYSGVARTPLMAVVRRVPFDGAWVPVMAEHFATTADVYRLLRTLPAHADLLPSADGREKTPAASAVRLARMLGVDAGLADMGAWVAVAEYVAECQLRGLLDAVACVLSRSDVPQDAPIVGAGVGRFLIRRLAERLERPYVDFMSLLDSEWSGAPDVSDCAPAAAVARLAAEVSLR
ncbi:hydantoinase/oxoprolinase family protein [Thiorhodococcus minor]|uniref:hydantoinase/oxoprolinase family protein n=1 Tax=Thiorhodococcus minor TaxID=57489 RepID=UPI001ADA5333